MAIVGAIALAGSTPVGAIGTSLLVAAGSAFDNLVLFPWLFPPDNIEGERIQGLEIPQSREGAPLPMYQGSARSEGVVVYQSAYRQIKQTDSVAGKNGPDVTTYRAETDLLAIFAHEKVEEALAAGKTGIIDRLYIDGELAWTEQATISYVVPISYSVEANEGFFAGVDASPGQTVTMELISIDADFTDLVPGFPIRIQGMQNAINNIDPSQPGQNNAALPVLVEPNRIKFSFKVEGSTTPFFEDESGGGSVIQLTQSINDFQSDSFDQIDLIPFDREPHTPGSGSFGALTELAASKGLGGAAEVPGYTGYSGCFLRSLNVTKYGNRRPTFHATYADPPSISGQHYRDLLRKVGLEDSEVEIGSKVGSLIGYKRDGVGKALDTFASFLALNNCQASEHGGKIRVARREDAVIWDVPREEIGAQDVGNPAKKLPTGISGDSDMPRRVEIEFSNIDEKYQVASESVTLPIAEGRDERQSLKQLSLTRGQARSVALRAIAEGSRQSVDISLPARWIRIQAGHVVRTETEQGVILELDIRRRTRQPITGRIMLEVVRRATEAWTYDPAVA